MPRPRNQAAKRQQLLDAALQVIHDRGPAEIQMKDVARAADMATGSVYYYYDNIDDLLRHVHQRAYERYYTQRAAAIADLADAKLKLVRMVDLGLPRPEDEPLLLALYQVGVAKARDPEHAEMITRLCGEQRGLYQQVLDEGVTAGVFHPLMETYHLAENLIALEDGYGLGLCTGKRDYTYDYARRMVLEAAAQWTQCPAVASA